MAAASPYPSSQGHGPPAEGHVRSKSMASGFSVADLQARARSEIKLSHNSTLDALFSEAIQANRLVDSHYTFDRPYHAYVEWIKADIYIGLVMQNSGTPFMNDQRKTVLTQIQTTHSNQRARVKDTENQANSQSQMVGRRESGPPPIPGSLPGSLQTAQGASGVDTNGKRYTYYDPSGASNGPNGVGTTSASNSRPISSAQADPLIARFNRMRVSNGVPPSNTPSNIPESLRPARPSSTTNGIYDSKPVGPRPMPVDKELPQPPPRLSTKALLDSLPRAPSPIYTPVKGTQNPDATPPRTSSMGYAGNGRPRERRPFTELPNPNFIEPEELFNRMKEFKLLLIDVRSRDQFDEGHIHGKHVVCIEPISLRPDMSFEQLKDDGMLYAPVDEVEKLSSPSDYDLVVYYDESTSDPQFLRGSPRPHMPLAMRFLYEALTEYNEETPLKRAPAFLRGGINAWIDLVSENALQTSETISKDVVPKAVRRRPHRSSLISAPSVRDVRSHRLAQYRVMSADEDREWREKLESERAAMPSLSDYQTQGDDSVAAQTDRETFMPFRPVQNVNEFLTQAHDPSHERQSMTSPPQSNGAYSLPPQRQAPQPPRVSTPNAIPPIPSRPPPTASRPSYSGVSDHRAVAQAPRPVSSADGPARYQPNFRDVRLHRTGLINFGNSCYMNSVIQCLGATLPLSYFFFQDEYERQVVKNWKGSNGLMPQFYARLCRGLWAQSRGPSTIRPSSLRNFCARLNPDWGSNSQQDAQEFLVFILDVLHEDLNQQYQGHALKELTWEEERFRESQAQYLVSKKEWQRSRHMRRSAIDDLFAGQWASKITCQRCRTTFTTHEVFTSLTLPIPSGSRTTLQECLKLFCTQEEIEYKCKPCNRTVKAYRKLTITRIPNVLVLSFNRYHQSSQKIGTPIDFPLVHLDINPFMADTSCRPGDRPDPAVTPPFTFDLYGVVRHIGNSAKQGHYIAVCKDSGGRIWREYNDDRITDFDPTRDHKRMDPGQAYILFYERSIPR